MRDRTLRHALAASVCLMLWDRRRIRAVVAKQFCPDCRSILITVVDQGIPHCWGCTTDRSAAQEARTKLTKLKMAHQGIFIEPDPCRLVSSKPIVEDPPTYWIKGMPL